MDKAVGLTRFATPETESRLLIWAGGVSCGAIRRKADVAIGRTREEVVDVERTFDEGRRFGLQGELPSAQGAVVAKALDRLARNLPVMPDEEGPAGTDARRADALVALCSTGSRPEDEPDRATVIVHARMDEMHREPSECEIVTGRRSTRTRPAGWRATHGYRPSWRTRPGCLFAWVGAPGAAGLDGSASQVPGR